MAVRRASPKSVKAHKVSRKATPRVAKKTVTKGAAYRVNPRGSVAHARKLHIANPSSATDIGSSLGVTRADIKAVLEAIGE